MLAAQQTYLDDGFWLSPPLFDSAEVEQLRAATARVLSGVSRAAGRR